MHDFCFKIAFLTKNLEFMSMCVMAGFNLYNEPWINTYLDNPDFIEYTDYYVKLVANRRVIHDTDEPSPSSSSSSSPPSRDELNSSSDSSNGELTALMNKTDQEINDLLNMDEYYFERFHLTKSRRRTGTVAAVESTKKRNAERAKNIYTFIRHFYTNPLSLKELARIQIRKSLLAVDFRMKHKIEEELRLPRRLKDYLLLKEFDI